MTQAYSTPLEDPSFKSMMQHFQLGEWKMGMEILDQLRETYPVSQDLNNIYEEIQVQMRIDEYEVEEVRKVRQRQSLTYSLRAGAVIALLLVVGYSVFAYSGQIIEQAAVAQEKVEQEVGRLELSAKFRNAQNLLQAGQYDRARAMFEEVQTADPNFPNVDVYLNQIDNEATLDGIYEEAMRFFDGGEYTAAMNLFREIEASNPFYRDVPQRIDDIERSFFLDDVFARAVDGYQDGEWQSAISEFEALRALDVSYEVDRVEEMLFYSYLNASADIIEAENNQELLETPEGMVSVLDSSEELVRKALALRPQDEDALEARVQVREITKDRLFNYWVSKAQEVFSTQTDSIAILDETREYYSKALQIRQDEAIFIQLALLEKYLGALDSFDDGDWSAVISALEDVYTEDQNFAEGTARQTLFEAYMARGEEYLSAGDYRSGLTDFERAGVLASLAQDVSNLQVYEAKRKLAYTYGLLLDYENAVLLYQSALQLEGLNALNSQENPGLVDLINQGALYVQQGNYRMAYLRYREALSSNEGLYAYDVHVVKDGDYLTSIARLYKSTVQSIAELNDITNLNRIYVGQELLVPKLPEE